MPLSRPDHPTRTRRLWQRLRGYRGAIDRIEGSQIIGWVARRGSPEPLSFELHCPAGRLISGRAAAHRADLEAAGIGDGRHGFTIPLAPGLLAAARDNGGEIALHLPGVGTLASVRLDGAAQQSPAPRDPLARYLFGPITRLRAAIPDHRERPALAPHRALLSRKAATGAAPLPAPLCACSDFIRHRDQVAERFPITDNPTQIVPFLHWYLSDYGARRQGLQIPMSREMIDWLNTEESGLTRAMRLFGLDDLPREEALLRWSLDLAPALGLADCLIPAEARSALAAPITPGPAPLTRAIRHLHRTIPVLGPLETNTPEDRRRLLAALLLLAIERPELLWLLPQDQIGPTLGDGTLSDFAATLLPGTPITRETYAAALRRAGFDLENMTFLRSPEGHRLHAAHLPTPEGPTVDVQILGPFRKAAGLGQSTRLSHHILSHTGFSLNAVDIARDNPTPELTWPKVAPPRPARINLLHLNAEAVPTAFAYEPDSFSGAYNIAYFYWELSRAPACHRLGLDLVDEIWVSSEFCAEIYRQATDKPVTNVGMCFEPPPEIDRTTARAALRDRFALPDEAFVALATFDSFSYVQRKNPLGTLRAFREAFADDPFAHLILKTQNRRRVADPAQAAIWAEIDRVVATDPRIHLLDETMEYDALLQLKAGADCYVSLHRSEGWGFGMLEAMALGVPVLCTGYSGNLEFCDDATAWLVPATPVAVQPGDYIYREPGQHWGEPDLAAAVVQFRALRRQDAERHKKAALARTRVRRDFSSQTIARRYEARLNEIFKSLDAAPPDLARPAE